MKTEISYLITVLFLISILIFTGCRQRGPRIVELPGSGRKLELKEGQYLDSILCKHPVLKAENDSILEHISNWNRKYTGDSLLLFLEECEGIPEDIAIKYDVRFYFFKEGSASGTFVRERYEIAIGSVFGFEQSRDKIFTQDIVDYTDCPICDFDKFGVTPEEANSFRREYDWREIIYFKKNNVTSNTANRFENPLRAYTICILANDRPDIPPEFANQCDYEKADNIIKIYDAGIPLEYANIAKPLIERYISHRDPITRKYTVHDLINDYKNNVPTEKLRAKAMGEVGRIRY